MKKVFYVSYGGGHANVSRFIYKSLEDNPNIEQEVLSLTVADKIFNRSKIPYKHLSDYLDLAFSLEDKEQILTLGKEIAETAHDPSSDVSYKETVAYMGCGMWDLYKRFGENEAIRMFEEQERMAFYPIEAMKNILLYVKPDVLVITCEVRMEGAAAFAANEFGIPTVLVTDFPIFNNLKSPATICVMNEFSRDYAIKELDIPEKNVVITGQPVFENDLMVSDGKIAEAKELINFSDDKKVIMYLPGPRKIRTQQVLDLFEQYLYNHQDWIFILKQHPNDSWEYSTDNNRIFIFKNIDVAPLLHVADVIVTYNSTAGLEAAIVGKPVISVFDDTSPFDFSILGVSKKITSISKIEDAVIDCLDKDSMTNAVLAEGRKKFTCKPNATENIAEIIKAI